MPFKQRNPFGTTTTTFASGRNADKRANRRLAVIERCARRFRESWARETRNTALKRPYGYPHA